MPRYAGVAFVAVPLSAMFCAVAPAEMVIDPAPGVIVTPDPAVSADSVYPAPLPIRSCPFVGTALKAVPPFATGMTPESEIVGVAPPEEASGEEAATLVTAPLFVAAIVTVPAPLVMLMPDPGVSVARP